MKDNYKKELKTLMGEDGYFARELTKIRRYADNVSYRTPSGQYINGYVNVMKYFRQVGDTTNSIEYYSKVQDKVETALRDAMRRAHPRLTDANAIRYEGQLQKRIKDAALQQDSTTVNDLLNLNRNRN